jgi:threonine/homoserine/homoserine lactone efflux protein
MFELTIALVLGILVGIAVSIPLGPVGIIVIQRTLARSKMAGFITGLGSGTADILTASIAAFGIHVILDFLVREHSTIRIVGGVILLIFGIASMWSKPREHEKRVDTLMNRIQYFFSGFVLTITNPFTPVAFFIAFANIQPFLEMKNETSLMIPTSLVAGIFFGTCLWWLLVTSVAEIYEHKITRDRLGSINKWLGAIVVFIAVVILTSNLLVRF